MNFDEPTIEREYIYRGKILNLRVDKVSIFNGNTSTREIIEHNGGVGIVALNEKKQLILVKQFRKPFEDVLIEIPAGKIEKDEDPKICGIRELEEETGYKTEDMTLMHEIYPSPGFASEILYIYFCDKITKGKSSPDEDENLEILEVDYSDALEMVYNGTIKDAKTIVGIMGTLRYIK